MLSKYKNSVLTVLISAVILLNITSASGLQSVNVSAYLNGTLLNGQQLPPLQSPSQIRWNIAASFSGLTKNISTTINQSQINYTDFNNVRSMVAYPLQVSWTANPALEIYSINMSQQQPINVITSNVLLGTVSQNGAYATATSAPACSQANLYTEWDFYITTQKNYSQTTRNIIVGRVCFYQNTIGYAYTLPSTPSTQLSSTLTLSSGTQQEILYLKYNNTNATSSDGLASASWASSHVSTTAAPPNGTAYVAISNANTGQWYANTNATYSKWYNQFYSFALEFIPHQTTQYGPTSVGILSNNCGISTSNLTNQSVYNVLQCMNITGSTYFAKANSYAMQLVSTNQNISNYSTAGISYLGKPAIAVSIPSIFISEPQLNLALSGAFTGVSVPAGRPAIISATTTSLNIFGVGTIIAEIENTGNSASLFNVTLANCPGIVTPSGVSYQFSKGEGQEVSIGIVAPNSTNLINENCILVVNDLSGGGKTTAPITIISGPAEIIRNYISAIIHLL